MILDSQAKFGSDQAITVTAASTNVYDFGDDSSLVQALNEKGGKLYAQVTTAFAGGTSIVAAFQTAADTAFTTPTTVIQTAAIATASLVAGLELFKNINVPLVNEQYGRIYYTVVGTMSAGNIDSGIALDIQTNK